MKLLKKLPSPVLLFSWLTIAAAGVLGAAEKQSQSVQVSIGTILASNQSDEIDAKLKGMESQLRFLKYRSYRLLKTESQNVPWSGERGFEIPGGRSLTVTPQDFQDNQVWLKIRLIEKQKPVLDTTVKVPNRRNFIVGGPPHEGGVLVLSISARAQ